MTLPETETLELATVAVGLICLAEPGSRWPVSASVVLQWERSSFLGSLPLALHSLQSDRPARKGKSGRRGPRSWLKSGLLGQRLFHPEVRLDMRELRTVPGLGCGALRAPIVRYQGSGQRPVGPEACGAEEALGQGMAAASPQPPWSGSTISGPDWLCKVKAPAVTSHR